MRRENVNSEVAVCLRFCVLLNLQLRHRSVRVDSCEQKLLIITRWLLVSDFFDTFVVYVDRADKITTCIVEVSLTKGRKEEGKLAREEVCITNKLTLSFNEFTSIRTFRPLLMRICCLGAARGFVDTIDSYGFTYKACSASFDSLSVLSSSLSYD